MRRLGIASIDGAPADGFSWDGTAVRLGSEAAVLIHEVAHWQIAPPARRALPDFGLGAGPETGKIDEADAACCVGIDVKEQEELLASLLGILWEAALGHPAIRSFVEQNWLEAWDRPAAAAQFARTAESLLARGLIDAAGIPQIADAGVPQIREAGALRTEVTGVPQAGNAATAAISIRNSGQASAETSTMADAGPAAGK